MATSSSPRENITRVHSHQRILVRARKELMYTFLITSCGVIWRRVGWWWYLCEYKANTSISWWHLSHPLSLEERHEQKKEDWNSVLFFFGLQKWSRQKRIICGITFIKISRHHRLSQFAFHWFQVRSPVCLYRHEKQTLFCKQNTSTDMTIHCWNLLAILFQKIYVNQNRWGYMSVIFRSLEYWNSTFKA